MKTLIKYIKLPMQYNAEAMMQEVNHISENWLPHYNNNDYTGEWKILLLRSLNGSLTQALAQGGNNVFEDTPLMQKCPAIRNAINSLQCEKMAVRLLNLRPGATIKPHTDPGLCYEEGEIRLHIPLQTNEDVKFFIEDEGIYPKSGECWYMNFNLKHHLANNGSTNRIHLVIDCKVNEWINTLFASCPEENIRYIAAKEQFSEDEQLLIIENLTNLGTPVALELARQHKAILDKTRMP